MNITNDNENCHNETAVGKLRNQLSPHYGLPEMVILYLEGTENKRQQLEQFLLMQAKQAQSNKKRIDELLIEIEAR